MSFLLTNGLGYSLGLITAAVRGQPVSVLFRHIDDIARLVWHSGVFVGFFSGSLAFHAPLKMVSS